MTTFAYAIIGGALIGLSATLLLFSHGRIAGISGIVGRVFDFSAPDAGYRPAFVAGLLVAGGIAAWLSPSAFATPENTSAAVILVAGVLVGAGTAMGSGCTSGHGVCGTSRLSPRSLVATAVFLGVGVITASTTSLLMGGQ